MEGLKFSIKMPSKEKWDGMFDDMQDYFSDEMVWVTRGCGQLAKTTVEGLTPRDTGETARRWFVTELGRGSHRGRFLGFTVVLDHPWNYPGAKNAAGKLMNRGDKSVLTDLEYGTRPHDIPVPSGILSFVSRKTGGRVFFNMKNRGNVVKHPGTKAYGFLRMTAAIVQRVFEGMGEQVASNIVAKMNARQP